MVPIHMYSYFFVYCDNDHTILRQLGYPTPAGGDHKDALAAPQIQKYYVVSHQRVHFTLELLVVLSSHFHGAVLPIHACV
jgi:hypothetical protein